MEELDQTIVREVLRANPFGYKHGEEEWMKVLDSLKKEDQKCAAMTPDFIKKRIQFLLDNFAAISTTQGRKPPAEDEMGTILYKLDIARKEGVQEMASTAITPVATRKSGRPSEVSLSNCEDNPTHIDDDDEDYIPYRTNNIDDCDTPVKEEIKIEIDVDDTDYNDCNLSIPTVSNVHNRCHNGVSGNDKNREPSHVSRDYQSDSNGLDSCISRTAQGVDHPTGSMESGQETNNIDGCDAPVKEEIKTEIDVDEADYNDCNVSISTVSNVHNRCHNSFSGKHEHISEDKNFEYSSDGKGYLQIPHITPEINGLSSSKKAYKCSECKMVFSKPSNLQYHFRTHSGEKPYECLQCRKAFSNPSCLNRHTKTHRWKKNSQCSFSGKDNLLISQITPDIKGLSSSKKLYECSEAQCKTAFSKASDFEKHLRTHEREKPYECLHCRKTFSNSSGLNKHIETHREKRFKCLQCGKGFSKSWNLKVHNRIHTREKSFQCLQCGKGFSTSASLNVHNRIHTGEKSYVCLQCGKAFSISGNLKVHNRIHTGEKPYQCLQCMKAFSDYSTFNRHLIAHTGEKPHQCSECSKAFSNIQNLKLHLRTHTGEKPHLCVVCGKTYTKSTNLKLHIRTHTGEKPHQCSECEKTFTDGRQLKLHKRTHTGEKPHQCLECGKAYSRPSALIYHMRAHEKKKKQLIINTEENHSVS